jgi:aminopeptidase N
LLVSFDYGDTLIKELIFNKTIGQLQYQLAHDQDVLGRIWALQQLTPRMKDDKTSAADRDAIVKAVSEALTKDKFWGVRLEAAAPLGGMKEATDALLAATKDSNARVRSRAITSLAASKDPALAETYLKLINDKSYGVIKAAALALGQSKASGAYDSLVKLIEAPSWRDTIKASALSGLAALGDKRALELGFKYYAAGNRPAVRAAALSVLGSTGKDDPRVFPILSTLLTEAADKRNFALFSGAAEAIVALGDERGLLLFQDLSKKAGTSTQMVAAISGFENRLRAKLAPTKPAS